MRMRRLSLSLLVAALALLALGLSAWAAPGDGSLVVTNANGSVIVQGRGLIYGHVDRGTLTVLDYKPDDITAPSVSGGKMKLAAGTLDVVYSGSDMRFLFPGGRYTLRIEGVDIDLSAVGKGVVTVAGSGSLDDGSFSVNGAKGQSITLRPASALYGKLS
jgi:hypothetical protein